LSNQNARNSCALFQCRRVILAKISELPKTIVTAELATLKAHRDYVK
jgi:hypothetical protein